MAGGCAGRFANKVVLVTGAASRAGIGFATAKRVLEEGAKVVLTDVHDDGVRQRARELAEHGGEAIGLRQDVADEAGWDAILSATTEHFGRLDGLVNNAGIVLLDRVEDVRLEDWRRQIDINLTGAFFGCRAAIRQMRAQGGPGAIVNVSSVAGLVGMRRTAAYAASKGGLRLMTKTLALEAAPEGIRVNSVHPGVIETDIQEGARSGSPPDSAAIAAAIPLGRTGSADCLGSAIAFLLSDDAAYVTGTELVVDGGLTAQ